MFGRSGLPAAWDGSAAPRRLWTASVAKSNNTAILVRFIPMTSSLLLEQNH
jgi:hypothetical protein